jgi:uncharacterized protein involved in type VI secretion and phage assembly
MSGTRYFGKYRGKVESNVDPLSLGRVQVSVPAVLGEGRLSWAMPCVPYAGPGVGLFLVPPTGANVWVEFEGGDPDFPILAGCFWGSNEAPATPPIAEIKMLKTDSITLTLSDPAAPDGGGLTIQVDQPIQLKMVFNASGIEVTNGSSSVTLTQSSVSLNGGALEVQ